MEISEKLEIERKYIIVNPDASALESLPGCRKDKIVQLYLSSPAGINRRIRKTVSGGKTYYIYNEKVPISSTTRIEKEYYVSEEKYERLITTSILQRQCLRIL